MRRISVMALAMAVIFVAAETTMAEMIEILDVKFLTEKVIEGKALKLNSVSSLKKNWLC